MVAGDLDRWHPEIVHEELAQVTLREHQLVGQLIDRVVVEESVINDLERGIDHGRAGHIAVVVFHFHIRTAAEARPEPVFHGREHRVEVFHVFLFGPGRRAGWTAEYPCGPDAEEEFSVIIAVTFLSRCTVFGFGCRHFLHGPFLPRIKPGFWRFSARTLKKGKTVHSPVQGKWGRGNHAVEPTVFGIPLDARF